MHGYGQTMSTNKYFSSNLTFLYAVPLISATFLLLIQVFGEPIKNYDGLYYLNLASKLLDGFSFFEVFVSKDSFLMPLSIYFLSNFFKISLLNSFYTLLFISNFFIAYFFFKIYLNFSKLKKTNFYVILIFFSFVAYFDDYGPMLLRDHVAWAFFLCSVFYLLKYTQTHKKIDVLLFLLTSVVGTFFRIELIIISIFIFFIINFYFYFSLRIFLYYLFLICGFFLIFYEIYVHINSHVLYTDSRLSIFNINYILNNIQFKFNYFSEVLISFLKKCVFVFPLYLTVIFDKKIPKNNNNFLILNTLIIFSLLLCIFHAMVTTIFTSRYLMFSLFAIYLVTVLNFKCDSKLKKSYIILSFIVSFFTITYDSHNQYDELILYLDDNKKSNFYSTNPKINFYLNEKVEFQMSSLIHGDLLIIDKKEENMYESLVGKNETILFNNPLLDKNFIIIQVN